MTNYGNPIKKIGSTDVSYIPSTWRETEGDYSPSGLKQDLTGSIHKVKIGSACSYEMKFRNINTATLNALCALLKYGNYVSIQLFDPMNGTANNNYITTKDYYVDDRTATLYSSALDIWSDLTVKVIERGVH